jgi:DNA polymerase
MVAKKDVFDAVIDYLTWLKAEGHTTVDVSQDTLRALQPAGRRPAPSSPPPPAAADLGASPPEPMPADPGGLEGIAARVARCRKCPLCETRTRTVPGQGNPSPDLMFVGEGPGADEDAKGLAFVGRAGQLLTKIIGAMGMTRDEVFIGNIVKCRPPGNRVPSPEEMEACIPYLHEQIDLLKPKVIVCLGATAVKGLFGPDTLGITKLRGQWKSFHGIDTMPTFHPAYLLRNPAGKRDVWDDMKEVLRRLGRPVPDPNRR